MSDRWLKVRESDLLSALDGKGADPRYSSSAARLRAELDALGPEPCGHPSRQTYSGSTVQGIDHRPQRPTFRCVAPKGHHAYDPGVICAYMCCGKRSDDPIDCGSRHLPPDKVWAES